MADFFRTTNTLVGSAMFHSTHKMRNHLIDTMELPWRKTSQRLLLAYKRVGWGWSALMQRFSIDPTEASQWKEYMMPELGMCAGVSEHPMGLVAYSDFLYQRAPFEPSYTEEIEASRAFMKELIKICDIKEMLPLLSKQESYPTISDHRFWNTFIAGPSSLSKFPINPAAIPYLRRLIAMQIHRIAIPMYHSIYLREETIEKSTDI